MRRFLSALLLSATPLALAQSPSRPHITSIAFMRVYSDNVPAAEKFYGATMGYEEKHNGAEMVFPINHHQWIEVVPSAARPGQPYLAALGFTVEDAAAMKRYLSAKGVDVGDGPQAGEVEVHDPEGNVVVFVGARSGSPVARLAAATPLSERAPSHHIIHVGMVVHDAAKEDAFWREILGFRPYWHGTMHPGRTDWVSLQVPDGSDWIEYMLNPSAQPTQHEFGMSDHFSLGVERMQTVLAALQRNGCEGKPCTAIQAGLDGKIQLNLFDPDQTRVEYMEFAPVMKPCCSEFTAPHPKPQD